MVQSKEKINVQKVTLKKKERKEKRKYVNYLTKNSKKLSQRCSKSSEK